ncbi:MAG: divalent-cation tolerance protein CutA [Terriglobia bacterium]
MTDKVVVFVTCASAEEAARIARSLVEDRLAACVNVSAPVRSVYHWEGRICDDQEVLLVIKTVRALFDRVRRAVEKLHSYQVPEVICLPVIDGAPNYLNWLTESVVVEGEREPADTSLRPRSASKKR